MQLIRLDDEHRDEALMIIEKCILDGGVVAGPTDTVYGFFCRADNESAIRKIFAIKQRPQEKSLPIFIKDIKMARWYAYISDIKACALEKLWPGPVTAVFHHKEKLPQQLTGGADTIGMRIPDHPLLLELLARFPVPLAQTSANISGKTPAKTAQEVIYCVAEQKDKPDMLVDGGEMSGIASIVVDLRDNTPKLLRAGSMTMETFQELLGKLG